MSELAGGVLEVGLSEDGREVIVNHTDVQPDENGCGHIVFSPNQAIHLAHLLLKKAAECNLPPREPSDVPRS